MKVLKFEYLKIALTQRMVMSIFLFKGGVLFLQVSGTTYHFLK